MNIPDLEAFLAVVETGSIVAASARLHLTQPAVSRRVQSLEVRLGVALLDRQSKPLKPTADGKEVYERGRRVIGSVADLVASVAPDGAPSGDLRLGVPPFFAEKALAQPLDDLRAEFPRLSLRITAAWSPALIPTVESGAIDAAVVLMPDDQPPPDKLAMHLLDRTSPILVASRKLPLPRRKLTLRELAPYGWVLNQDGCGMRRSIRRALEAARLPFDVAVEAFGTELQLSLVARGLGIGAVTPAAFARSPSRGELRALAVPEFRSGVSAWLIHLHTLGRLAAPVARFSDQLGAVFSADRPRGSS